MGQQPLETLKSQSATDLVIFVNVAIVIEVDEIVAERLPKDDPDDGGEKNANRDRDLAIFSRAGRRRNCRHL
jgi:hypothetical protein